MMRNLNHILTTFMCVIVINSMGITNTNLTTIGSTTDFNDIANWDNGAPSVTQNCSLIVTTGVSILQLSQDTEINNLYMESDNGGAILRLDLNGFNLTVNGVTTCRAKKDGVGPPQDQVQIYSDVAGKYFKANGAVVMGDDADAGGVFFIGNGTGGEFYLNTSSVTINDPYASGVGAEGDFHFDYNGTTTLTLTGANYYQYVYDMVVGGSNTVTLNLTGANSDLWIVRENLTIKTNGTLDCGTERFDSSTGNTITLESGSTLKTAYTSTTLAPFDNYSSNSLDPASTVYYEAAGTQLFEIWNYGDVILQGSGDKRSVGASSFDALTVQGTAAYDWSTGTGITINNTATISNGASFKAGSATHTIKGSFVNNGTFTKETSVMSFAGSGDQAISGTVTPAFYTLDINNGANTVNSSIDFNTDNFQFTGGKYLLDGETVTVNSLLDLNGGTLQVTNGTLNLDDDNNDKCDIDGGTLDIDGGTVNIGLVGSQTLTDIDMLTGEVNISGGILNVTDEFDMNGGTFTMSGGTLNIKAATGAGAGSAAKKFDITAGTTAVTGGDIYLKGAYDSSPTYPALDISGTTHSWTGGTVHVSQTGSDDENFYIATAAGKNIFNLSVDKTATTGTHTIWLEDFSDISDGAPDAGVTAWSTDVTGTTMTGGDHFEVRSNKFSSDDTDGEAIWTSETIDIEGFTNVGMSIDLTYSGSLDAEEYIKCSYILDGGSETSFATNGSMFDDTGLPATASHTGLSGTSLVIIVRQFSNFGGEMHFFDDITVTGDRTWGGAAIVGSNLDVNGTVTIASTARIDNAVGTLTVATDWTNNGQFTRDQGTVTFDGNVAQLINGSVNTSFYNVTFNNSHGTGITLSKPTTITGLATFTDGYVNSDATNLLIFNDGATASAAVDASYVSGPCKKIGNDDFDFPIGAGGKLKELGISSITTVTQEYTAQYFDSKYSDLTIADGSDIKGISYLNYWNLDQTSGTDDAKVKLYWTNAGVEGIGSCADITVGHFLSGAWSEETGTASGTCSGAGAGSVITDAEVATYSPFALASKGASSALPIELVQFDANKLGENEVITRWVTASEINTDYFVVEHSNDGKNFTEIGDVPAAGNSNMKQYYELIDYNPFIGTTYYRLQQFDINGSFNYSNIITVNRDEDASTVLFEVFPNPVNLSISQVLHLNIQGFEEREEVLITMIDVMGREMYSKLHIMGVKGGVYTAIDPKGSIPAGLYTITGTTRNEIFSKKIVVN